MTNFATFIDSANPHASLAQRGKAKQKRADLRLVGLGLVVTRDGGIPVLSHTYPGNRPDVTQFASMLTELCGRYTTLAPDADPVAGVTAVFDAGQNSTANFADLRERGIGYVTSLPPSDHPDLLALPASSRQTVDADQFGGLSAVETRKDVYGTSTRVILTHSPTLHVGQAWGLEQTLAKAQAKLVELADRLARGKTRRGRDAVAIEVATICKDPWIRRILTCELTGEDPADLRLSWSVDDTARAALEGEVSLGLGRDRSVSGIRYAEKHGPRPPSARPHGHIGIPELCDICPLSQLELCRNAHTQPSPERLREVAGRLPEARGRGHYRAGGRGVRPGDRAAALLPATRPRLPGSRRAPPAP